MSHFAILRLRKRQLRAAGAMARHALREDEVRNADPARAGGNARLVGAGTAAEVMKGIRAVMPERRRRDAVEVVELLISASPEAIRGRDRQAQDRYFSAALRWIGERFGGPQNVHLAVVHRDESTPHMQVLVTPLVDGRLVANRLIGGPAGLRAMQTEFAELVGRPHGLVRGLEVQPGERRPPYQSIRRWYSAIAAAGSVNAIPPLQAVPRVPPEPAAPSGLLGLIGGRRAEAQRREYEAALEARKRALAAREAAVQANNRRRDLVERLATIGLAVYGGEARRVGERVAVAVATESAAAASVARQRETWVGLDAQTTVARTELAGLERDLAARRQALQLDQLEDYRDQLAAETAELEQRLRERRR